MRGREMIAREIDQALEGRVALVCPTLPIAAPPIGAATVPVRGGDEPVRNAMLRLTQPFNLGRQPARVAAVRRARRRACRSACSWSVAFGHTLRRCCEWSELSSWNARCARQVTAGVTRRYR